jgi:hypothetical protein
MGRAGGDAAGARFLLPFATTHRSSLPECFSYDQVRFAGSDL